MGFGRRLGVLVTALATMLSLGAATRADSAPAATRAAAAAAAAMVMPAALAEVVARDPGVAGCAKSEQQRPSEFAAHAFVVSQFALRGAGAMTLLEPNNLGCGCNGPSCRVLVYEQYAGGYRRVLDEYSLLPDVRVEAGGSSLTLSTRSDMQVFEETYVWNGTEYAHDPLQSHVYDMVTKTRRVYERAVRFAPGTDSATFSSYVTHWLNEHYVVHARAGQTMSVELLSYAGRAPTVGVFFGDLEPDLAPRETTHWSGRLPRSGNYDVYVMSSEQNEHVRTAFRVSIRIK